MAEFENNFDDLLNKPSSSTISETLSEMDVSNPFHDVESPLASPEETSDTEVNDSSIFVNSSTNPLESSQSFTKYEPQASIYSSRAFEDVSSVKGVASSSASAETHAHDRS